jgi:hypothetical protein
VIVASKLSRQTINCHGKKVPLKMFMLTFDNSEDIEKHL